MVAFVGLANCHHLSESIRKKVTVYPNNVRPGERLNFSEGN